MKAKTKADPLATGGIFVVAMASPSRGFGFGFFSSFFQTVWVSHGVPTSVHGICCCALKLQVMFGGSDEGHARFWKHPSTPPSSPVPLQKHKHLCRQMSGTEQSGGQIFIFMCMYAFIDVLSCILILHHVHSDIQVKEIYHCGSTSTSQSKSHACKFDKTRSKSNWE